MEKTFIIEPKMVLIFNEHRILIAIMRSLHYAARLTNGNATAISFVCTGKNVTSNGYYYRHLHQDVLVEMSDINKLTLEEYDNLCGVKRIYYSFRKVIRYRKMSNKNRVPLYFKSKKKDALSQT